MSNGDRAEVFVGGFFGVDTPCKGTEDGVGGVDGEGRALLVCDEVAFARVAEREDRGELAAAIVDAINTYQLDALVDGGYIKDRKRFDGASMAEGDLWKKKYEVAERFAGAYLGEISKAIKTI